ncbi:MAG: hypothetical protein Q4D96_10170 [Propionibacteriaceae bacterium]|nr:hypothetical protein [Propionibacteriaceae bacterium]
MSESITFQPRPESPMIARARARGRKVPEFSQDSLGYDAEAPYGILRVHLEFGGAWRASLTECGEVKATGAYATREEAEAAAIEWGTKGRAAYAGTKHERTDWMERV